MQRIAKMEKHYDKLTPRMESDTSESKRHGIKVFDFDLTGPLLDFESAPRLTNHQLLLLIAFLLSKSLR